VGRNVEGGGPYHKVIFQKYLKGDELGEGGTKRKSKTISKSNMILKLISSKCRARLQ